KVQVNIFSCWFPDSNRGRKKGTRARQIQTLEFEAIRGCPRNCERRALGPKRPLGNWEGRTTKATTREPGDLPARSPNRWTGRPYGAVFRSGDGMPVRRPCEQSLPRHSAHRSAPHCGPVRSSRRASSSPDAFACANANEGTCVMGRYVRLLGATSALAACLQTASAQDNPQGTQVLPTIVVSPTTIPTPEKEIASSVTVITAADIERQQYRTVPDALSAVPGLNVVQTGGPGGQTSVFIRGTNSNQVKVLIDGVDASDPSIVNRAFDFAHLLTGDIARIEVLRGPQSGLYGSGAIRRGISITTKKGEGPAKGTATLEGGSFKTFNQTAAVSGSEGAFNYAFNVLHYRVGSVPVTPLDLLAPGVQRNNDNYDNWTYSTRLGYDITD